MTHRVIWEDVDGSIKQTVPSPEFLRNNPNFDLNNLPGVSPNAVRKQVIPDTDAPADRTFRNAWKWDNAKANKVGVDVDKAKHLAADKIREARKPVLERLDVDYQRADEANDVPGKAAVVAKKNKARNATTDSRITNAVDADELKAAMFAVIAEVEAL